MKTKFRNVALSVGLTLLLLFVSPFQIYFPLQAQQNAQQPTSLKVNTKNIGGAFELTIDPLSYGNIKIYLPDDMAAGDTISSTVVTEPKGNTEEERAKNQATLNGYALEIGNQKVPTLNETFTWVVPDAPVKLIRIIEGASGKEVASMTIPGSLAPLKSTRALGQLRDIPPQTFLLPNIGQQGRPLEIFGPFDGNFDNTSLRLGDSGARILAESPRKLVFRSPAQGTGAVEMNLKEGGVETRGTYRNLGVHLSAPKTNLLRGERTVVTIEIVGLEGIKENVPLQIDTRGVVNMDGGNFQNMQIRPTEIQPGGRFTTTRAITGQQPGGFSVTATVIVRPFDMCLQDDSVPARVVLWNTFTGDYIFTNPDSIGQPKPLGGQMLNKACPEGYTCFGCTVFAAAGPTVFCDRVGKTCTINGEKGKFDPDIVNGACLRKDAAIAVPVVPSNSPTISDVNQDRRFPLSTTSKVFMKGCIITLSHNTPDRRVFARLDVCTKTGEAEVQTSAPKEKITITDKNTADSTCAAAPK